jgi:aminopeptidase-like protein
VTTVTADRALGEEMYALAARLFPICRSITGDGVRQTIDLLSEIVPFQRHEIATGTAVLDWSIPEEWNISEAYIADKSGTRIIDFNKSNLHVLNYSTPIRATLPFAELRSHIFTLPEQPELIPYRTSYYQANWGFCMSHRQLLELEAIGGDFEVVIDSRLQPGHLTWAEYVHHGTTKDEILLSTHICHPSLANDNCSGLALLTLFARELRRRKTRYTYRFLVIPGTIGSLTWLALNEERLGRIKSGLVLSGVGDASNPTYKKSRRGNATIDRAFEHVLRHSNDAHKIIDFFPYGYDERQFCSPGFNLPVGLFQRGQFGTYPEYHTSADNLSFISGDRLADSYATILNAINVIDRDRLMLNLYPKGEPQLGRRGIYGKIGGTADAWRNNLAMLWVLNLSDGEHSLLDIAERAELPFDLIHAAAELLEEAKLVVPTADSSGVDGSS